MAKDAAPRLIVSIAAVLLTALTTLTVWGNVFRQVATVDQVKEKIETTSPWIPYEKTVLAAVDRVETLDDRLDAIHTDLAVLSEKLDTIIRCLPQKQGVIE